MNDDLREVMEAKKVLIVEDEEDICKHMKRRIETHGWRVFVSSDCNTAIEIFKKERPQACLIDINMPAGPDGIEILKKIKAIDKTVKCIMITCVDDRDKLLEAKAEGANGYFVKPLDSDKFNDIIKRIS